VELCERKAKWIRKHEMGPQHGSTIIAIADGSARELEETVAQIRALTDTSEEG
jgi:hypothetical protein